MRRGARFAIVAGAATVLLLVTHVAPEALGRIEYFQVRHVELEGLRYLDRSEALAATPIPMGLSVWDDPDALEAPLRRHALVASVSTRRRLPGTLILEIVERRPVALYAASTLVPVDREGRALPIDPARHRLDLPLLNRDLEGDAPAPGRDASTSTLPQGGPGDEGAPETSLEGLTPEERRLLAGEVVRLEEVEPRIAALLSDASLDAWGDVILRLGNPRVAVHYRPPLSPSRLGDAVRILTDALGRHPERIPEAVDLRFDDQVVVRYSSPNPR